MSKDNRKITAVFLFLDKNNTPLKNIDYKVTEELNNKEHHVIKGKTNSKGKTFEFIKPTGRKICLYIKIGTKEFKKYNCLHLPSTKKNKLIIRAKVSAILVNTELKEHEGEAGDIKRKDYQVLPGDTLEGIAKKNNTTVAYLSSLNPNIQNIHKIFPGDWIKVPISSNDKDESLENKDQVEETSDIKLNKNPGNNQNGHPAEQISYDSDTTVYHIYHDGHIERENRQAVGYAAFIYYDESGNKHYLGKTEYIKTRRWSSKSKLGNGHVYLVCIGGDKYSDDINDNELSPLEKNKRLSRYRKGNVGYNITINSRGQRYYLLGSVMAAFLGALCKLGYDDISFNGASKKDGSPGVSSSHINGNCIDVRYLRKDKAAKPVLLQDAIYDHQRTVNMVNIFYEFGFGRNQNMLSERFVNKSAGVNSTTLLPHCSHYNKSRHNNHLHMQGFKPNMKDIDVIHRPNQPDASNNSDLDLNNVFEAIMKEEGFTTYMYLDTSKLGGKSKVTIGYGKMIGNANAAAEIPFIINGSKATTSKIISDWTKVYNSVPGINTYKATYFEQFSTVRIRSCIHKDK